MRYYARFGVGLLLGAAGALVAAWLTDSAGPVAAAGALLGMLGFLASFFVWDPDRPPSEAEPEGYEQVLFDRRNNTHLVVLLVLFAAGAYGPALAFGGGAGDAGAPVADAMAAELDSAQADLVEMNRAFSAMHDAFTQRAVTVDEARAMDDNATALRLEIEALEVSGALVARRDSLSEAAAFLSAAFASLASCVEQDADACFDARIMQSEALNALDAARPSLA